MIEVLMFLTLVFLILTLLCFRQWCQAAMKNQEWDQRYAELSSESFMKDLHVNGMRAALVKATEIEAMLRRENHRLRGVIAEQLAELQASLKIVMVVESDAAPDADLDSLDNLTQQLDDADPGDADPEVEIAPELEVIPF